MKITVSYITGPDGVTCVLDLWGDATLSVTAETHAKALLGAMRALGATVTIGGPTVETWRLADNSTVTVIFT